jgi:hypothetical protein
LSGFSTSTLPHILNFFLQRGQTTSSEYSTSIRFHLRFLAIVIQASSIHPPDAVEPLLALDTVKYPAATDAFFEIHGVIPRMNSFIASLHAREQTVNTPSWISPSLLTGSAHQSHFDHSMEFSILDCLMGMNVLGLDRG